MSTSRKTPRRSSDRQVRALWSNGLRRAMLFMVLCGPLSGVGLPAVAAPSPTLACDMRVPATVRSGQPVPWTLRLHNHGSETLLVLVWNTPFEGVWMGESVQVRRGRVSLSYGGPRAKRGAARGEDYLSLPPGQSLEAQLDLAQVYELGAPGRYTLALRGGLHDVQRGRLSPASPPSPWPLSCQPVQFQVLATGAR